jgi:hypothetical protein
VARYHFHLVDRHETIPDEEGLEVTDLAEACKQALRTIEELRPTRPSMAAEWKGWKLEIANASGAVVVSINLDEPLR